MKDIPIKETDGGEITPAAIIGKVSITDDAAQILSSGVFCIARGAIKKNENGSFDIVEFVIVPRHISFESEMRKSYPDIEAEKPDGFALRIARKFKWIICGKAKDTA